MKKRIRRISEEQFNLIKQLQVLNLKTGAIAKILGISTGTVLNIKQQETWQDFLDFKAEVLRRKNQPKEETKIITGRDIGTPTDYIPSDAYEEGSLEPKYSTSDLEIDILEIKDKLDSMTRQLDKLHIALSDLSEEQKKIKPTKRFRL